MGVQLKMGFTAVALCIAAAICTLKAQTVVRLTGQVLTPAGTGVQNLQVTLQIAGYPTAVAAVTNATGQFQFTVPMEAVGRQALLRSSEHQIGGLVLTLNRAFIMPRPSAETIALGPITETVVRQASVTAPGTPTPSAIGIVTPPAKAGAAADANAELLWAQMERNNAFPALPSISADRDAWPRSMPTGDSADVADARARSGISARQPDAARPSSPQMTFSPDGCAYTPAGARLGCGVWQQGSFAYKGGFITSFGALPQANYRYDLTSRQWWAFDGNRWLTLLDQALELRVISQSVRTQMQEDLRTNQGRQVDLVFPPPVR